MRRVLIFSVSALALLATSQAFALDQSSTKAYATSKPTTKLNVLIPQSKVNGPVGHRATDMVSKAQNALEVECDIALLDEADPSCLVVVPSVAAATCGGCRIPKPA
jgi:hypothetical protein